MIFGIVITGLAILVFGYFVYGRFVEKRLGVDPRNSTPAHTQGDNVDFVPAKPAVLLGHHFSSIAGAALTMSPSDPAVGRAGVPARPWSR